MHSRFILTLFLTSLLYSPALSQDVPVKFSLNEGGYVTIVLDDADGKRVKNLIQETFYPAGSHTVYWDGTTEGKVVNRRANILPYDIKEEQAPDGTYRARAIVHDGVELRYEFSVQSPGNPPWMTENREGGWIGDHAGPADILFLPKGSTFFGSKPQVVASAVTAEANHAVMWLDAATDKKLGGKRFGFKGGKALTRDLGSKNIDDHQFYLVFERKGLINLHAQGPNLTNSPQIAQFSPNKVPGHFDMMSVAAYNGMVLISLGLDNTLVWVDAKARKIVKKQSYSNIRGVHADANGNLFLLAGSKLLRYDNVDWGGRNLGSSKTLVSNLEDPQQLTVADNGKIYVSDWGQSHQVKVFQPGGQLERTIGKPGGQQIGRYDEARMHYPYGLDIVGNKLWVAELSFAPKRISRWSLTGSFDKAFYGSPRYGGGGELDRFDKSRYYYVSRNSDLTLGMEFELNWSNGTSKPKNIYSLSEVNPYDLEMPCPVPSRAVVKGGERFLVCAEKNAQHGARHVGVWRMDNDGVARPVAALGSAGAWSELKGRSGKPWAPNDFNLLYTWTDKNKNQKVEDNEVSYRNIGRDARGSWYIDTDLSVMSSGGLYVAPASVSNGLPSFDLSTAEFVAPDFTYYYSDVVKGKGKSWFVNTNGPFHGFKDGEVQWTYHSQWPNRTDENPPTASYPGQIIDTGRVIGQTVDPKSGDAGEVWGIMGNFGNIYLLTIDGYFVTELGCDRRLCEPWGMDQDNRGMILPDDMSFRKEHWWPTISQMGDGKIYMVAGFDHSSVVQVQGLESIRRLDLGNVVKGNGGTPPPDDGGNGEPLASDDQSTTKKDTAVEIKVLANDSDPDGDALKVKSVANPANGSASILEGKRIRYVPANGFIGTDSFTYVAADGNGGTDEATVTVKVEGSSAPPPPNTGVNDPPIAKDDSETISPNKWGVVVVLANDSDPDGDPIKIKSVSSASNGQTEIKADKPDRIKYTPKNGFEGTDTFTYTISDGNGGTATAKVTVKVGSGSSGGGSSPDNAAPTPKDDQTSTQFNKWVAISVLQNDKDPDGDNLKIVEVEKPSSGQAEVKSDKPHKIKYTPKTNFTGTASFRYKVSDGNGGTAWARVTVEVVGASATTAVTSAQMGAEDEALAKAASPSLPTEFALHGNYPNPFSNTTSITYDLVEAGAVELTVFNMLGQRVATLVREGQGPGSYTVEWDGRDESGAEVGSGTYLYRVQAGDRSLTRTLSLVK